MYHGEIEKTKSQSAHRTTILVRMLRQCAIKNMYGILQGNLPRDGRRLTRQCGTGGEARCSQVI
jgi:hypothetical protein